MGKKQEEKKGPEKPLASEHCSKSARGAMKRAEKEGKKALCHSCVVGHFQHCRENGHVLCSNREDRWVPIPFNKGECGLYTEK